MAAAVGIDYLLLLGTTWDTRIMPRTPRTPDGLGARGLSFWRRAQRGYDFSASELELLTEICRCLDELEEMATNGAAARDRATARTTLGRLLAQLGLQDEEGSTLPSPGTLRARTAARERWHGASA